MSSGRIRRQLYAHAFPAYSACVFAQLRLIQSLPLLQHVASFCIAFSCRAQCRRLQCARVRANWLPESKRVCGLNVSTADGAKASRRTACAQNWCARAFSRAAGNDAVGELRERRRSGRRSTDYSILPTTASPLPVRIFVRACKRCMRCESELFSA